jgi:phosphatidylglycerophosphatase A
MLKKNKPLLITPDWHFLCQHPAHLLAFGLGSGLSKRAPGTMGSLLAIPLYGLLSLFLSPLLIFIFAIMMFFVGVWAAGKTSRALGLNDYSGIVIDEIVAMWMVLAIAPSTWLGVLSAFALFRLFDILKPWPIRWFDQHIPGGLGVMVDDVIAALFVIIILLGWKYSLSGYI